MAQANQGLSFIAPRNGAVWSDEQRTGIGFDGSREVTQGGTSIAQPVPGLEAFRNRR